jgi:hypothetical protein
MKGAWIMKKIVSVLLLAVMLFFLIIPPVFALSEYDVEKIIGLRVSVGTYRANISRDDSNLYLIHEIGDRRVSDCYIKTKYCYEYGQRINVIIEITNPYSSYAIGKIYF